MIVALRTSNRKTEKSRADNLDRVGHDLVFCHSRIGCSTVGPIGRHPQEARRYQFLDLVRPQVLQRPHDHFIAGQLFLDETIKRHVIIEGLDHVVAVLVGIGANPVVVGVALRVRVTGHVQPVPPPPLAVVRRFQATVDQPFVGIVPLVIDESLGLLERRRQPQQVQVDTPDQGQPICVSRKAQFLLFQPGEDE